MNKIKSIDDLRKMKQDLESGMNIREKSNSPESLVQIRVAMATCGIASGARTVMNTLIEKIESSTDPEIIAALQRQIFSRIVRDNPYLFLVIPNELNVYSRRISGIKPTITGIWEDYIDWEKK